MHRAGGGTGAPKPQGRKGAKAQGADEMGSLLTTMARLQLSQAAEVRELAGATFVTILVPEEHAVAKAVVEVGVKYQEDVTALRKQKKELEAAEDVDEAAEEGEEKEEDEAMEKEGGDEGSPMVIEGGGLELEEEEEEVNGEEVYAVYRQTRARL